MKCWGCRVTVWALVGILIALLAQIGAVAAGGLAVVTAIATALKTSVVLVSGLLGALVGLSLIDAVDALCCKVANTCCPDG